MVRKKKDSYFIVSIIILILLPHLFVIFAHQEIILNWFTTDDAFYYFKTAQNIVEGQGVTFDGIARTNGFHPLWMVLLLPIFSLARFDLILPLRLVVTLQVILGLGSSLVIFQFIRTRCSQWVAFLTALIWAFTPMVYQVVFKGGTEAGLNAFFLVLLWWQYYQLSEKLSQGKVNFRRIAILGGLASLVLLCRLDNVYLIFIAGGWLLLRFWQQPGVKSITPASTFKWWLKLGFAYFTPIVTTLGLYLIVNQLYIGSAMPVSGKIKRWWGTLQFTVYGKPPKSIADFFSEFFSANDSVGPWAMVMGPLNKLLDWYYTLAIGSKFLWGALLIALLGLLFFLLIRNRGFFGSTFWRWNLIPLFVGCLVQISYYKLTGHIAQKEWYWMAEILFIVFIFGIMFEIFSREAMGLPKGNILVASTAIVLAAILSIPYLKIPFQVINYVPSVEEHFYLRRSNWLEGNTEPNSLIGMTGSGSSGYFVQDRVLVNLDGLISSQEYFVHLQNATADEYLESIGLDYVFGNAYILQRTNPYQWNFENRLEEFRYFEVGDKILVLFRFR